MAQEKARSIVFMGTPAFARDILAGLAGSGKVEIKAVYTQPDRPAGRGKKLVCSPVKELALGLGLEVRQPVSLKRDEAEQVYLSSLAPDYLIVAAYGMILPQSVLDIPAREPINVHTSLLPAYRGSAPVQRALMNGETRTGISIMRMELELDAGPVYSMYELPTAGETAGSLLQKMAPMAVPMLLSVMDGIEDGSCTPKAQQGEPSYAAKILKSDGAIDFARPIRSVEAHIRGVTPDPGAHAVLDISGTSLGVVLEEVRAGEPSDCEPGCVLGQKGRLCISCEDGLLDIVRLKPQGKKSMDAASFVNGLRLASKDLVRVGHIVSGDR